MRIALFTSNRTLIPPEKNVIAASAYLTGLLADNLVDRGHDVTLYAPKGSRSKAKLIDLNLPPNPSGGTQEWELKKNLGMKQIYLCELYKNAQEYDIIHVQTGPIYLGMPFAKLSKTPTIFTCHNDIHYEEKAIFEYFRELPIVSLSNNQRLTLPNLNYIATVYNGIDPNAHSFSDYSDTSSHMYFLGRVVINKGIDKAIQVAQLTKRKLLISGDVEKDFFLHNIKPYLSENIEFLGLINKENPNWSNELKLARLLLFPIQWEEPFGLVIIESMACGTPVIAYARGSVPEVIKDGETGFIINSSNQDIRGKWIIKKTGIEGLCEAVERIYNMSAEEYKQMRVNCRKHVEENFSVEKMVDRYEEVYKKILEM